MKFFQNVDELSTDTYMRPVAKYTPTIALFILIFLTIGPLSLVDPDLKLEYIKVVSLVMFGSYFIQKIYEFAYHGINPKLAPLHMCELGFFLGPIFIINEMYDFIGVWMPWAVLGSFLAMLTPEITVNPNRMRYWTYYIPHVLLVYIPIYMFIEFNVVPSYTVALYGMFVVLTLSILVGLYNTKFKTNFMFVSFKHDARPKAKTLLDLFGPKQTYAVRFIIAAAAVYWLSILAMHGIQYLR